MPSGDPLTMNPICIKAVNPDNDKELRSLARLFAAVYASNSSSSCTKYFEADFWRQHAGTSFVSLAAFAGDSLIGHLGLVRSRSISGCMELILPAFDVATLNDMYQIAESGFVTLQRLALRQKWESLCSIPHAESVEYLPILTDVLGFNEIALLPSTTEKQSSSCTSLWFKRMQPAKKDNKKIYIPERIEQSVRALLTDVGIEGRVFCTHESRSSRPNLFSGKRLQLCTSDIVLESVSALSSDTVIDSSTAPSNNPGFYCINASQPDAIRITEALLAKKALFCGFIPDYSGADHIITMNFPLSEAFPEERFSKSGKILSFAMRTAQHSFEDRNKNASRVHSSFNFPAKSEGLSEENSII